MAAVCILNFAFRILDLTVGDALFHESLFWGGVLTRGGVPVQFIGFPPVANT